MSSCTIGSPPRPSGIKSEVRMTASKSIKLFDWKLSSRDEALLDRERPVPDSVSVNRDPAPRVLLATACTVEFDEFVFRFRPVRGMFDGRCRWIKLNEFADKNFLPDGFNA